MENRDLLPVPEPFAINDSHRLVRLFSKTAQRAAIPEVVFGGLVKRFFVEHVYVCGADELPFAVSDPRAAPSPKPTHAW
tara:strand:+ start:31 stop:267 length:237 start_codon:yes stop_codon:yes gene_type:complete